MERPDQATFAAVRLLEKHGITSPPVDVEVIAKMEGIDVVFEDIEDDVSGFLVQSQGVAVIGVNRLHHRNRQRFTIAHEIGHHRLHPDRPTVNIDEMMVHFRNKNLDSPFNPEEFEANSFAAALLMPEEFIRRDLADQLIDIFDDAKVRQLARQYEVSAQALTIRLMNLGMLAGLDSEPW